MHPMLPILCPSGQPTFPCPQHLTYLCPPGHRPWGSPLAPGRAMDRSRGIFLGAARGAIVGISRAQGHLTAGGPGQGHRPPSKDAPGSAAGNFPRHRLFPGRGGAAMPSLFLKAQQAVHPLLCINLPLLRPQPWPPNLAGRFRSSPRPHVSSPCLPQPSGSSRESSVLGSGPSLNPPPARARLMKTGRPVPIRQVASLNRERRGLPRALCLAPGPELWSSPRHGAGDRPRAAGGHRGHRGSDSSQPRQGLCPPPWPPGLGKAQV